MKQENIEKISEAIAELERFGDYWGDYSSNPEDCDCAACIANRSIFELKKLIEPLHRPNKRYQKRQDNFPEQYGINREKIFSDHWEKENERRRGQNSGYTILEYILDESEDNGDEGLYRRIKPVTWKQAEDCASVIAWLGTNCGWAFLQGVLSEIKRKEEEYFKKKYSK